MKYISRTLERELRGALKVHSVIVVTGARQVGKSTLLENAFFLKKWRRLTLDDPETLDQSQLDPKGLLWDPRPTIIDEIQRCEQLMLTVKYYVDKSKKRRKFILSGSGNIPLRKAPRESLAGRVRYLHLSPLGYPEIKKRRGPSVFQHILQGKKPPLGNYPVIHDIPNLTWNGGLPEIVLTKSFRKKISLMAGYVDTYISRDIQDLMKIRHPDRFRRLMEALAKATGWASKQEELAQLCGEERSNVSRYISLLKETSLLHELKGFHTKKEKAYRHSKYYWFDSGLACFLSGLNSPREILPGHQKGRYFENFIHQQIVYHQTHEIRPFSVTYWQPKGEQRELDFVIQTVRGIIPMEVKSSKSVSFQHTKTLRRFMASHPEAERGFLIYPGGKLFPVATNLYAIPISAL